MFSIHSGIKLLIKYRNISGKSLNTQKLNKILIQYIGQRRNKKNSVLSENKNET